MSDTNNPTACVLIIGNEILSGRTQDVNLAYIGKRLTELGVRLAEARVVADEEDEIVAAVNAARARYTYVFTTGGIGPTHDDITSESVAKAFGRAVERNPEARRRLEAHYARTGMEINEARLRMADMPTGAELIDNPVSTAPGFQVENVFVLAGVPSIAHAMFEECVPRLDSGPPIHSRTVIAYLPEGTVAEPLGALQEEFPDVQMGSYPFYRAQRFGASLVLRSRDVAQLDAAVKKLLKITTDLGGEPEEEAAL